jgi:hypothetical protein
MNSYPSAIRPLSNIVCLVGSALALLTGGAQAATTLLNDTFDTYANQAAFQSAWTVVTGTGGTLSTAQAVSSPNSVNFGTAAARNDRSFTESGNPAAANLIFFSFDFYDSNAAASPYRQVSSLIDGAGSASGQLVSLGMNNNQLSTDSGGNYYMARILGYTVTTSADPNGGPAESGTLGAGAFFKLNDYGVGLRSTGWHNLAVKITDTAFNFFVDGALAETVANTFTLRSYDSVRLGSGLSSTTAAYFDNVKVEQNPAPVPEPSTALLSVLGGLGVMWMARRRTA